ncbi:hybrid sensor histidine kinase/response regulator [Pseudomonas marincola]|uniref:hybrid sensor histidine kinase/response regulator n=1 Tax=Pseudomonas marincola TaxID=437900 RepID=UPI0008DF48B2|nr:hybrid sensor histidine kinase/response regulator [Pseudomonas marincola]SFT52303.1 two-component system, chemotaxis family, sensor histidine kinase and response regulator WspE [Pseudomonas marincola]
MTPDQMRDASLLELFKLEAEAQTQLLGAGLLVLEREPQHAGQLEACMRAAHSLKGAARIVGLDPGVKIAHAMEDIFVAAQEGLLTLASEHIDGLLQGADMLMQIATPVSEAGAEQQAQAVSALVARLQTLFVQGSPGLAMPTQPPAATASEPPIVEPESERDALDFTAHTPAEAKAAESLPASTPVQSTLAEATGEGPAEAAETGRGRVLRVSSARLDHLLDMSGKSLVEFQQTTALSQSLMRLKRTQAAASKTLDNLREITQQSDLDPAAQALLGEVRKLLGDSQQMLAEHMEAFDDFAWQGSRRTQQLYDAALESRMRPFADVLKGQARMVRDLGRSLGKQVRLDIEGESTQVDRDVLERLEAPLTHLLRNAVDHGIEDPQVRINQGKPAEGRLLLRARHHAGMLALELHDDGAGVDLQRLRTAIVARKLAPQDAVERMSEDELLAFLFLPGFSMRESVTEVSGRGVGLDAVMHEVRQLRGGVRMQQVVGGGSRFFIEVPLTLSVVRSLVVEIGGEAYAIALAHIERMIRLQPEDIVQLEGRQHFWYENRHVSLVSASQLLQKTDKRGEQTDIAVVILSDREQVYGLAVERFIGERTLVVMPLDRRLGKVRDVSAGALLDDGTPVLILDVEDLCSSIGKLLGSGSLQRVDRRERQAGAAARKRVLVVDDSLTVRELERKLLLARGYDVAVAVDGMDGWNALRAESFDLLITDIDMPRMDGIELVGLVRRDSRLQSLPVMVVSYKDRAEDRQRGLDAGADYYLAKASFHDEALLDAVQLLIGDASQ